MAWRSRTSAGKAILRMVLSSDMRSSDTHKTARTTHRRRESPFGATRRVVLITQVADHERARLARAKGH